MKQNISAEDLQELTEEQKKKLKEMWKPKYGDLFEVFFRKDHHSDIVDWTHHDLIVSVDEKTEYFVNDCFPLLNIGDMIEILIDEYKKIGVYHKSIPMFDILDNDLCNKLWIAVKSIL